VCRRAPSGRPGTNRARARRRVFQLCTRSPTRRAFRSTSSFSVVHGVLLPCGESSTAGASSPSSALSSRGRPSTRNEYLVRLGRVLITLSRAVGFSEIGMAVALAARPRLIKSSDCFDLSKCSLDKSGYSGEGEHRFRREAERHSGAKVNSSRSVATLVW